MRSTIVSTAAVVLAGLQQSVSAQTFSACNPMKQTCPPNPALGTTVFYDFTKTSSLPPDWSALPGTTPSFSGTDGLQFVINTNTNAPTIAFNKYIMYGEVEVYVKASNGAGIVSSVILLSDTLDEIDWEWRGSYNDHVQSNFFGKGNTDLYNREKDMPVASPLDTVNKYKIVWSKDSITWTVNDGNARVLAYTDSLTQNGYYYPQTPMQVKLGNWVGCATQDCYNNPSCATHGTCQWVGGYFGQNNPGPYVMSITNITIKDYSCGTAYSYGDNSGSAASIQGIDSSCSGNTTSSVTSVSSTASSSATSSSVASQTSGSAPPLNLGQGTNNTNITSNVPTPTGTFTSSPTSAPTSAPSITGVNSNVASGLQSHASAVVFTVLGLAAAAFLC